MHANRKVNGLELATAVLRGLSEAELMDNFQVSSQELRSLLDLLLSQHFLLPDEVAHIYAATDVVERIDLSRMDEVTTKIQAASSKARINGAGAARDVLNNMEDAELMKKYGLSEKGLASLFEKLVAAGHLSSQQIQARSRKSQEADLIGADDLEEALGAQLEDLEAANDVRARMPLKSLSDKYGIAQSDFGDFFVRLVEDGYLDESDIGGLASAHGEATWGPFCCIACGKHHYVPEKHCRRCDLKLSAEAGTRVGDAGVEAPEEPSATTPARRESADSRVGGLPVPDRSRPEPGYGCVCEGRGSHTEFEPGAARDLSDHRAVRKGMYLVLGLLFLAAVLAVSEYLAPPALNPAITNEHLFIAIREADTDLQAAVRKVGQCLERGADVNARWWNKKTTALIQASQKRSPELVRMLLKSGAEVNAKDTDGVTPLIASAISGNAEVVKMIVSAGASLNEMDRAGMTALGHAVVSGSPDAVKALLDAGADANLPLYGSEGLTPLMLAVREGHPDIVKLFLTKGANLRARDARGFTALKYAGSRRNPQLTQLLRENGAQE